MGEVYRARHAAGAGCCDQDPPFGSQSLALPYVERGGRIHVSSAAAQARWRGDMSELYYIAPDKKLMCVPSTQRNGTIEPGNAFVPFETRIVAPALVLFQYDARPDGQEFLTNSWPPADTPLSLIVNWEEIEG